MMRAHLYKPQNAARLSRLVLVDDPEFRDLVAVWWRLDRPRRWRCSVHGWVTCQHVAAAVPVLRLHLLGDIAS